MWPFELHRASVKVLLSRVRRSTVFSMMLSTCSPRCTGVSVFPRGIQVSSAERPSASDLRMPLRSPIALLVRHPARQQEDFSAARIRQLRLTDPRTHELLAAHIPSLAEA